MRSSLRLRWSHRFHHPSTFFIITSVINHLIPSSLCELWRTKSSACIPPRTEQLNTMILIKISRAGDCAISRSFVPMSIQKKRCHSSTHVTVIHKSHLVRQSHAVAAIMRARGVSARNQIHTEPNTQNPLCTAMYITTDVSANIDNMKLSHERLQSTN